MITLFEKYKSKKPPKFKIGDRVVWIFKDERIGVMGIHKKTNSVAMGDVCEITDVKTEYSLAEPRYLVKAKNLKTDKMINLLWSKNGIKKPYNINGHWIDDIYFEDELEYNTKKYNL